MLRVAILAASLVGFGAFAGISVAAAGPMADAGLDQTVTIDTTVQLDGTGSAHPDGTLSVYEWTIRTPDGREIEPDCTDCERSQFTPSATGRYEVTLTVTGPDGDRSTDTLYVYVQDAGPDVELSGLRTPDPDEPETYTASAESPGSELEEIAWAVEDEIVAVRSLDGVTDESELSLAFRDTETHRVQVVVRDTNGRTAYDQLLVQPQSGSSGDVSWSETDPPPEEGGCDDSGSGSSSTELCDGIEPPEEPSSEPDETRDTENQFVHYQTDGYETRPFIGLNDRDSSYAGTTAEEIGFDDGENAHWRQDLFDKSIGSGVEAGSKLLFGQEEKTATCEMDGGNTLPSGCGQRIAELEETGETANAYSPTTGGGYSEYGLTGGERVRGTDPTELEDGQKAEVTVVIQQEEEGIVDKAVDAAESSADRIGDAVGSLIGDDEDGQSTSSDSSSGGSSSGEADDSDVGAIGSSLLSGEISKIQPGGGTDSGDHIEPPSPGTESSSTADQRPMPSTRSDVGLVP